MKNIRMIRNFNILIYLFLFPYENQILIQSNTFLNKKKSFKILVIVCIP